MNQNVIQPLASGNNYGRSIIAIAKIMIMQPATDTTQILQTPDRFIMNLIPIEFGPMPDRSDQGAAQRFIRKEHEPVGRVFMQYWVC